jgi:hypothetical protein
VLAGECRRVSAGAKRACETPDDKARLLPGLVFFCTAVVLARGSNENADPSLLLGMTGAKDVRAYMIAPAALR